MANFPFQRLQADLSALILSTPAGQPSCFIVSSATGIPSSFGATEAPRMNSANSAVSTRPVQMVGVVFIFLCLAE